MLRESMTHRNTADHCAMSILSAMAVPGIEKECKRECDRVWGWDPVVWLRKEDLIHKYGSVESWKDSLDSLAPQEMLLSLQLLQPPPPPSSTLFG